MNWQEILTILIPILGMMAWVYSRLEKKLEKFMVDVNSRFEKIDARFDKIEARLNDLNVRLTRLEGRFDERGYWESRKTGTHDEK